MYVRITTDGGKCPCNSGKSFKGSLLQRERPLRNDKILSKTSSQIYKGQIKHYNAIILGLMLFTLRDLSYFKLRIFEIVQ